VSRNDIDQIRLRALESSLSRCPFCGYGAMLHPHGGSPLVEPDWWVSCMSDACDFRTGHFLYDLEAVACWNRIATLRVAPQP